MSKPRKKLRCICKGKQDRHLPGIDRQKHVAACPVAWVNQRSRI